ncbi:uncharacterized protein [Macrobrachium rosenbergii]|uniref:uncharacterized protein isoform X1 n=2 Tax=Macrobrachium rosenbergii TaxID=79674 RepID=UPI0034D733AC
MSEHSGVSYKVPPSCSPLNLGSPTTTIMTYDDDHVTSPLCELALGTIVEAKEGSNSSVSGESETESCTSEPPEPPPPTTTTSLLKKDVAVKVTESREAPKVHPDIDGGWAWVVFVAMFCIFSITAGLLYATGLYYVKMLDEYGQSRSYTAWLGSLVNAFFMLGGPVSSAFIQRFGCRASLMFGSVVTSIGYICSAFTNSLELLFVTYGVVVACGMNFCYSGQIIALAQYFDKKQSIATSAAMIGIGIGMFFLSSLTEYTVVEYGWRGSFLFNAGLSLQIAFLGALVFPIRLTPEEVPETLQQQVKAQPGSVMTLNKGLPPSRSRALLEKTVNDRSFSSLNMSMGASYLSHSLLSLSDPRAHHRGHNEPDLKSNQHSFCSRSSHFGIRSNAFSFSIRGSHAGLSQYDLHPNQYSFHHRDSYQPELGIRSNNQSFCSRKESQAGMSGLVSNPASFCIKASQMELNQHQPPHDMEMEKPFGSEHGPSGVPRAVFLIREEDCDLSCCTEDHDEPGTSTAHHEHPEQRSKCTRLIEKVKLRTKLMVANFSKSSADHPLMDPRFWLMDFSVCLCMLGTLTIHIIYKDFTNYLGVGEYYTVALSGIGVGDAVGRVGTGFLMSLKFIDPIFTYGLAQLLCCFVLAGHLLASNMFGLLALSASFGLLYGSQNILIAMAPSEVFGRDKLVIVFGHILFLGGIGALVGAPIAGAIVDATGLFEYVVLFSVTSLFGGSVLMFICYLIHHHKQQQKKIIGDEV